MNTYFAATAPGLEVFTRQEAIKLNLLSPPATSADAITSTEPGGVTFKGELEALYRANLHLRTASRVLARLGNFFYAKTYPNLLEKSARLPWERFLHAGQSINLRVSCHKSRLNNARRITENISTAISARLGKASPIIEPDKKTHETYVQLISVRLVNDQCTVSIDSSGTLLHKRGYRQAIAKAPLRETLAAAMLMASGWDRKSPLLDPFCGSGPIPIEAAMMALGIPPGKTRRFAFMDWPGYDKKLWQQVVAAAKRPETKMPLIMGSDRDAGAIRMAQANANRAGVADYIQFENHAVSNIRPPGIRPPGKNGWVVTNPPYGQRLSGGKDLRNLYAQFGNVLRRHCANWQVAVLCSHPMLIGQMHLDMDTSIFWKNGGISVKVARGKVG
jgi:putative N6-adenine-specific DNA methylase